MGIKSSILSRALAYAASSIVITAVAAPAYAQEQNEQINIEAQSLGSAVNALARQTGAIIIAPSELVEGKTSQGLSGNFTAEAALARLLVGSGLEARRDGSGNFVVRRAAASAARAVQPTQDDAATASVEEEIIVTGYALQTSRALNAKREEVRVADFISQDELGRVPDYNLADAVRRLPGVQTVFDEDEGRFISVRGLPPAFTSVDFNGTLVADGFFVDQRQQNVEFLTPTAIKLIEVIKSPTPDLDGNTIGGYINIRPISAFDSGEGVHGVIDAMAGHHTFTDTPGGKGDPSWNVNGRLTSVFGSNDQFGLVIAGQYFVRNRDQSNTFTPTSFISGQPAAAELSLVDYSNSIERYNLVARLEFKPIDNFYTALTGTYYSYSYDEYRYFRQTLGSNCQSAGGVGSCALGQGVYWLNRFPLRTENVSLQWENRAELEGGGVLDTSVSYSIGEIETRTDADARFRTAVDARYGFSFDLSAADGSQARPASFTLFNPQAFDDLSAYNLFFLVGRADVRDQAVWEASVNYLQPLPGPFALRTGVKLRRLEFNDNSAPTNYTFPANVGLAQFRTIGRITNQSTGFAYDAVNINAFENFVGTSPLLQVNGVATAASRAGIEKSYNERIYAGYAMLDFASGPWSAKGGLRAEITEWDAVLPFQRNGEFLGKAAREGYNVDWLPSFVASYDVNDDMTLRFGAGRTIGRPDFGTLATNEVLNTASVPQRLTRGNPDLLPREATSYDLAFDWRFQPGSLISAAIFFKDITNEIITRTDSLSLNGVLTDVQQQVNAANANVLGLELTYADPRFEFLPKPFDGFGLVANLSYFDGEYQLISGTNTRTVDRLNDTTEFQFNASLLYEYGPFESRLTYAYIGERRLNANINQDFDQLEPAYEQWDAQARLRLGQGLTLIGEARNIGEEARVSIIGAGFPRNIANYGASYWLGAAYRF